MWSATKPTEVGRYGWRPSPAEPGRVVDIVDFGTQFALDATGHVVEGGEWWQGPVYAWEQAVSAETASAAFRAWKNRCDQSDGFRPCAESFEVGFDAGRAAEPVNAELLAALRDFIRVNRFGGYEFDSNEPALYAQMLNAAERAEQQPADTRDATIARLRTALERIAKWHGEFPDTGENWPGGAPVTREAQYGSNGERDYMREVARAALGEKP